ncbi:MAG: hypothetical protein ACI3V3_08105 [Faecousia sp.]
MEYGQLVQFDLQVTPVDLSYDAATGKLYLVGQFYRWKTQGAYGYALEYFARFYEVDMTTGEVEQIFETGSCPACLYVQNGMAYYVDSFVRGRFTYLDLNEEHPTEYRPLIVPNNWGKWYYGRSFICDEYTGTLYALRDKNGKNCTLGIINLGDTDFVEIGRVETGTSATGLFIR